jgi:hypothetical protein
MDRHKGRDFVIRSKLHYWPLIAASARASLVAPLGALLLLLNLNVPMTPALAQENDRWIDSWTASPQPLWSAEFPVPTGLPANLWNQTIRQVVKATIGGSQARVILSNEFGDRPLVIGAAHMALAGENGSIDASSDNALTFSGEGSITIPPGAPAISDPIDLDVPAFAE